MESNKAIRFGLLVCLVIAVFTFLNISDVICQQTYNVKEATLTYSPTTTTTYNARDKIVFGTGFRFDSSVGGKRFVGEIKESLELPADYSSVSPDASSSREIDYNLPVGAIQGQLDVSPTGAAVYTIPIDVAPGTCGMQPELSVVYNSQSGNGLVGLGWNLSGISAITRVGQNKYYDGSVGGVNIDNNDRLMMDGQRLMLIRGSYGAGGSEYRTEQDNFCRITSSGNVSGGAASYLVEVKGGKKLYYDKQYILALGQQPYMYLLSRVEDANGNYMTYNYKVDVATNEITLSSIDYTGTTGFTPYNKV